MFEREIMDSSQSLGRTGDGTQWGKHGLSEGNASTAPTKGPLSPFPGESWLPEGNTCADLTHAQSPQDSFSMESPSWSFKASVLHLLESSRQLL